MTTKPWTSPHCRLAAELARYEDEHERCPVVEAVRVTDGTRVFYNRCDCGCHREDGAPAERYRQ